MRPPILQWKVSLALLAVVLVAVTLGSALRPTSKPQTLLPIGGWTGYTRTHSVPPRVLKTLLQSLPKNVPTSGFKNTPTFGFLSVEHTTPLDRFLAWLDKHA